MPIRNYNSEDDVMRMWGRRGVVGSFPAIILAAGFSAQAQSLADIDQRAAAVTEAWEKTPLTVRRAIFVSQRPAGYGIYEPRPTNVFKPGEPLLIYAEPIGYGWTKLDSGLYDFGFAVDFLVKTAAGTVLGGQDDFGHLVQRSHLRNQEFMLTLTMDLTGVSSGDLVLVFKLRDITGPKIATFELPFSVKA